MTDGIDANDFERIGMRDYLVERGIKSVRDVIGSMVIP